MSALRYALGAVASVAVALARYLLATVETSIAPPAGPVLCAECGCPLGEHTREESTACKAAVLRGWGGPARQEEPATCERCGEPQRWPGDLGTCMRGQRVYLGCVAMGLCDKRPPIASWRKGRPS